VFAFAVDAAPLGQRSLPLVNYAAASPKAQAICSAVSNCGKGRKPLRFSGGAAMLVLSRKVGEKILIGDNIAVTVVRVAQGIVRIGVEAPAELPIVREELKGELQNPPPQRKPAAV
jgi:carbon storage regulator